ncbi:DUF4279 domain-containing protein [Pontibacter akesuensis]|uniref:DUF4279 domain-containing protein n=1 Tax=Pontibacter akesuensis TaxID=388950 RepID=A0A1I7FG54_9BACT|nr:DUF4279 domain-containing protein [Pontibacter akesuensis]GHA62324.1 hypothetical protein GCM10007389_13800 [Pontibacter akesuensis]SFU35157.1 protein of unknown function [Pontibacter akesuensis]
MNKTLSHSYVYFALQGDDFDPNEVTIALGIEPTDSWKKGDKGRYIPNQKFASWMWSTGKGKESIFLEKLVEEVIDKFGDKVEVINKLKYDYQLTSVLEIVMYIDVNTEESTPALGHNLKTIEFLYQTQTVTDVDIYRYDSAETEE